jgi:hypothetical protein
MSARTGARTADFGALFDAPDCSRIVERRTESIVAPQALFLMNDPLVAEIAASLARRVEAEVNAAGARERVARLYEIVLGRPATPQELEISFEFLADGKDASAWARYCHILLRTNEFAFVD